MLSECLRAQTPQENEASYAMNRLHWVSRIAQSRKQWLQSFLCCFYDRALSFDNWQTTINLPKLIA